MNGSGQPIKCCAPAAAKAMYLARHSDGSDGRGGSFRIVEGREGLLAVGIDLVAGFLTSTLFPGNWM